jgi:hypothetical protein
MEAGRIFFRLWQARFRGLAAGSWGFPGVGTRAKIKLPKRGGVWFIAAPFPACNVMPTLTARCRSQFVP